MAQRYLEGRHLRDVAERFAVVDRAGSTQASKGADVECGRLAQEEIKRRLVAEVLKHLSDICEPVFSCVHRPCIECISTCARLLFCL